MSIISGKALSFQSQSSKCSKNIRTISCLMLALLCATSLSPSTHEKSLREGYVEHFASKYVMDPNIIRAVIEVESGWDSTAQSYCEKKTSICTKPRIQRAHGLMQIMPTTAWGRWDEKRSWRSGECSDLFKVGDFDGLFNEAKNIECGTRYLSRQLRVFPSLTLALFAYNAGAGATMRAGGHAPTKQAEAYAPKVIAQFNRITNKKTRLQ